MGEQISSLSFYEDSESNIKMVSSFEKDVLDIVHYAY